MKTVLITGASGYIGSSITHYLVKREFTVYATARNSTNFERCSDFNNRVRWINVDNAEWKNELTEIQLDLLIHAAWQGVGVNERKSWDIQLTNFTFSQEIFDYARKRAVKKIIALGSQAEYGLYKEKVSEEHIPLPMEAYGSIKLLVLNYLRNFAHDEDIQWYWVRVFSVFGKNENKDGLLPVVIASLLSGNAIDLTEGGQKYDYMYVDDFVSNLAKIVDSDSDFSGIYNLCSGEAIEIRSFIMKLVEFIPGSEKLLNFGRLPYRKDQNMYMVGHKEKFVSHFGEVFSDSLESNLQKTIQDYQKELK
jgi:nucleoside-diphosphate-sugar epimerase